ncbi:unannotated protein [freshwater metagenome]|uniref:Unannotated protein n=1 Tax=freshwater metagenome TaxID=449393 RepID=A0A6J6GAI6_9ZZZZ
MEWPTPMMPPFWATALAAAVASAAYPDQATFQSLGAAVSPCPRWSWA